MRQRLDLTMLFTQMVIKYYIKLIEQSYTWLGELFWNNLRDRKSIELKPFSRRFLEAFSDLHIMNLYLNIKVIYTKVEQVGCIILAHMHSSSDIMQGHVDFSSIYVIGQLWQL